MLGSWSPAAAARRALQLVGARAAVRRGVTSEAGASLDVSRRGIQPASLMVGGAFFASEADAAEVVAAALSVGVTDFDTAPLYGDSSPAS